MYALFSRPEYQHVGVRGHRGCKLRNAQTVLSDHLRPCSSDPSSSGHWCTRSNCSWGRRNGIGSDIRLQETGVRRAGYRTRAANAVEVQALPHGQAVDDQSRLLLRYGETPATNLGIPSENGQRQDLREMSSQGEQD